MSIDKARTLPVYRSDGVNTAANSSQLSDRSAAIILASEDACARLGLSPLASIRSTTVGDHVISVSAITHDLGVLFAPPGSGKLV